MKKYMKRIHRYNCNKQLRHTFSGKTLMYVHTYIIKAEISNVVNESFL